MTVSGSLLDMKNGSIPHWVWKTFLWELRWLSRWSHRVGMHGMSETEWYKTVLHDSDYRCLLSRTILKYDGEQTVFTRINSHSLPACSWSWCCCYLVGRVALKKNTARNWSVWKSFRLVNFWNFCVPLVDVSLSCSYIMYKCDIIASRFFEQFVAQYTCVGVWAGRGGR